MKKIILFSFSSILALSSCTDYLKKPILEDLSVNELRAAVERDSDAVEFYEKVKKMRIEFLEEESKQVKYGDITYRQLYDYSKKMEDSVFCAPIRKEAQKEWDEKYGGYDVKVDSISDYWKKYKEEHSLSQYAQIEFSKIDKEYYTYSHSVKNVNFGFKITPLKGKIDQLSFAYIVRPNLSSKDDDNDDFETSFSLEKGGSCICTSPISSPVVKYWELSYTLEDKFKYSNTEDIKRDYTFSYLITRVRYNGENLSYSERDIPWQVREYWNMPDVYKYFVITEYIDANYQDVWGIYSDKLDIEMKKIDKKCYDFLEAYNEYRNKKRKDD